MKILSKNPPPCSFTIERRDGQAAIKFYMDAQLTDDDLWEYEIYELVVPDQPDLEETLEIGYYEWLEAAILENGE